MKRKQFTATPIFLFHYRFYNRRDVSVPNKCAPAPHQYSSSASPRPRRRPVSTIAIVGSTLVGKCHFLRRTVLNVFHIRLISSGGGGGGGGGKGRCYLLFLSQSDKAFHQTLLSFSRRPTTMSHQSFHSLSDHRPHSYDCARRDDNIFSVGQFLFHYGVSPVPTITCPRSGPGYADDGRLRNSQLEVAAGLTSICPSRR